MLGCIGGDALYAVLAARLWEPTAEMVAPVGCDFPSTILDRMETAGLSSSGLTPRTQRTLHNRIVYEQDGTRSWTLFSTEADFHKLSPRPEDIPIKFREAEAFMVLAMTLAAQETLVEHLRDSTKAIIALDPQEDYIVGNEASLRRLVTRTDIFMPSADEVRRLLGHEDWSAAARTFAEWGPKIVVIKLGNQGCLVYDRPSAREFRVAAVPATVRDATGAGDCFCGAFLARLIQDPSDLPAAARAATVTASFAVEGYGAEPMFKVSMADVRGRLAPSSQIF